MVDTLFCDLGDVYHTFFSRSELKESTELFDADDFTGVDLSLLVIGYDDVDQINGFLHHGSVGSANGDSTFIGNINLHTGLFDDRIDRFSSLSYNITDLFRIDLDLDDLRCVLANTLTRLCNGFCHDFIHDVHSCFACSCDSFFDDRSSKSVDLDIHLDRCDTFLCTCYLEIHVSKEIFQSLDVCQNDVIIIALTGYQTTGNTCDCRFDRYTGCHQGHAGCTDTCL